MDLIRRDFDPWRVVSRLHDADGLFPWPVRGGTDPDTADWLPAVDIEEQDERFVIRADVPGVESADLEIIMENGVLSLQGTREARSEETRNGLRCAERIHGRFRRSFSLPDSADSEGIVADYQNGVVEITIPKHPQAGPRRIDVKAN